MIKQKKIVFEYILDEIDVRTIKKCLYYTAHRIESHKKPIAKLSEVQRILKELDGVEN